MKYLGAVLVLWLALALPEFVAAEEVPLDLGDTNLLVVACQTVTELGEAQDLIIKNCRRSAPDEIIGPRAVMHIRLKTDWGFIPVRVKMHKSLWSVTSAVNE